jgi:hypothetical protein
MKKPRGYHTRAVDHDADYLAACLAQTSINRPRGRRRCRVHANDAEIPDQTLQDTFIKGRRGAVVDDNDLVILGRNVLLVRGG